MNKREFLRLSFIGLGGIVAAPAMANNALKNRLMAETNRNFQLPVLRFDYNALHPFMDTETVSLLYNDYHAGYLRNFVAALKKTGIEGKTLRQILTNITNYPETIRVNGGGHFNYRIFWKIITPGGRKYPFGTLQQVLIRDFGSVENFKSEFSAAAESVKGNGWAWLVIRSGRLKVASTTGQDNPLMSDMPVQGRPLLCLNMNDVAFSSVYGNNSPAYVKTFWDFVNWNFVAKRYSKVRNLD